MAKKNTPVRLVLLPTSPLQDRVQTGLAGLATSHRHLIDASIRVEFADSLDIDEALAKTHANENRWDYLLGHAASEEVVAVATGHGHRAAAATSRACRG